LRIYDRVALLTDRLYDIKDNFKNTQKQDRIIALYTDRISELEDLLNEFEHAEFDNYPEIFQYFLVDEYFADKLEEKGEVIIRDYDTPIWGRQTCGQAILLDHVISLIAEDMEILEGMANSWEEKR